MPFFRIFLSVLAALMLISFSSVEVDAGHKAKHKAKQHAKKHRAKHKAKHRAKHKARHKAKHKQQRKVRRHRARHHYGHAKRWRGPPPWAPAHGYRYKHGHVYKRAGYAAPFAIHLGRCNKQALGTAIGGVVGGVVGSRIGKGDGRTISILGGVVIGAIIGNTIGRSMDEVDQTCISQSLEHGVDGKRIAWVGASGGHYQVTPLATVESDSGRYCREYQAKSTIAGAVQVTTGIACRGSGGVWRLAN